ncbi:MAG: hypothetical protein KDA17_04115 [Candidatus Saccharibacteria bacterium]|nr:hypothetical protein [Candidatus Saccharibacteria bacterium]
MNLNELATEIYEANKANGWWDDVKEEGFEENKVLEILKEAAEMHEAIRKGKLALHGALEALSEGLFDKKYFEVTIKDSVEDEAADVVIRILDWHGYLLKEGEYYVDGMSTTEELYDVHNSIARRDNKSKYLPSIAVYRFIEEAPMYGPSGMMHHAFVMFAKCGIPFERIFPHVKAKLEYNKTRGALHGKKF